VLGAEELNDLYNRTCAGLALSFTNITLVAAEMLAAGNIPVVNDHEFARPMLRNPEVVWSQPTPTLLADALSSVVTDPERSARSARAAAYTAPDWAVAQSEVSRLLTGKAAWTV
jgi:glycosyltransferase involved in cell wall biosynthesis